MYRTDLWTQWEKERVGWIEGAALTYTHCPVKSSQPVRGCCMMQGAQPALRSDLEGQMGKGRQAQEGRDRCTIMTDLHYYTAETIPTL